MLSHRNPKVFCGEVEQYGMHHPAVEKLKLRCVLGKSPTSATHRSLVYLWAQIMS